MKPIERKISASIDGKTLYLQVNGELLSVPWQQSYFYAGEKVRVLIEQDLEEEKTKYIILPHDQHLPKKETHWRLDNGISSSTN